MVEHGTYTKYIYGCRCDPCRNANRISMANSRAAALARPVPARSHGTSTGYNYWQCRCDPCRAAQAAVRHRTQKARRAAARAAVVPRGPAGVRGCTAVAAKTGALCVRWALGGRDRCYQHRDEHVPAPTSTIQARESS